MRSLFEVIRRNAINNFRRPNRVAQHLEPKMLLKFLEMSAEVDIYLHEPIPKLKPFERIPEIKISEARHAFNDVVDGGEIWIAELLSQLYNTGAAIGTPLSGGLQHIAVGTGSTGVDQIDFDLAIPIAQANASKSATNAFNAGADNKFTCSATFLTTEPTGQPYSLVEAGIFAMNRNTTPPTASDGITNRMFNRTVFSTITKDSNFELTIQWTIQIGTIA